MFAVASDALVIGKGYLGDAMPAATASVVAGDYLANKALTFAKSHFVNDL